MAGGTSTSPGHQSHLHVLSLPPIITSKQNAALGLVDTSIIFSSHTLVSSRIHQVGPGAPVPYLLSFVPVSPEFDFT